MNKNLENLIRETSKRATEAVKKVEIENTQSSATMVRKANFRVNEEVKIEGFIEINFPEIKNRNLPEVNRPTDSIIRKNNKISNIEEELKKSYTTPIQKSPLEFPLQSPVSKAISGPKATEEEALDLSVVNKYNDYYFNCKDLDRLFEITRNFLKNDKASVYGLTDYNSKNFGPFTLSLISLAARELKTNALIFVDDSAYYSLFGHLKKEASSNVIKRGEFSVVDNLYFLQITQLYESLGSDLAVEMHLKKMEELFKISFIVFPDISEIKNSYKFWHPFLMRAKNISIFSEKKASKLKKMDEIGQFYKKHGIKRKGLFI